MDAFLNVIAQIQAYGDRSVNSNPRLKYVDWKRDNSGIAVKDPKSEAHSIDPGATKLIYDGTRATTIGVSTAFDVTLSTLDPSRYRFTHSAGSNPTLRADRNLALNGRTLTIAVLANSTATVTVSGAGVNDFTGVLAGDTVYIPHTTTGDAANVLSVLNAGLWLVLAVPSVTQLSLARFPGQDFEATSEAQVLAADAQFQAFSTNGVQVGDHVDISSGFATPTRRTFEVIKVTSKFFEVMSTAPLPAEAGITPGAAGMIFYTDAKGFLYIEADQDCAIRVNGATDNSQRLAPVEAGNQDKPGQYLKRGPSWSLSIVNRATVTCNVLVIHAE
jgi:hypothetical protein